MGKKPVKVAILGAGSNTRSKHIPGLLAIEGVEIVGVCNRSRSSSKRVADEFGIEKIYDNWLDLVRDPEADAIVIGTWPYLHCDATLAGLEADKHVLCEARMAMSAEEARSMWTASLKRPHLVAQVVPSPMTLRVDRTIKRLVSEGFLGEVLVVEVRAGGKFLDKESPLHWRQDVELSGFNTLSLGIWYEAVMRWIGEAARVSAMAKTFVKMRKDENGLARSVHVPEHIDVTADMACGAQLHCQISAATGLAGPPEAILFGTEGTLRFSRDRLFGGRSNDDELREIEIPTAEEGGWRVEEEFIGAIRGEEQVKLTRFADGVKYMEFTEAAIRSARSGEACCLPLG